MRVNYLRFKKGGWKRFRGGDFGGLGNGEDQSSLLEQQETDIEAEMLGNVEPGGDESITIGDFAGVVEDERLELREDQVRCVRKKGIAEGEHVLASMGLFEEAILDKCQAKLNANQDVKLITEAAGLEISETNKIRDLCRAFREIPEKRKGERIESESRSCERMESDGGNSRSG